MAARSRPASGALQGWAVTTTTDNAPDWAPDPAFAAGSTALARLPLCESAFSSTPAFPWLILIPRVAFAQELEDLAGSTALGLMDEIILAGWAVRAIGEALGRPVAKLNVGALGNVTSQLHVHVVGRRPDDAAWPGPVWGVADAVGYGVADLALALAAARLAVARTPPL